MLTEKGKKKKNVTWKLLWKSIEDNMLKTIEKYKRKFKF